MFGSAQVSNKDVVDDSCTMGNMARLFSLNVVSQEVYRMII